jgi:copper homeostasis protein
MLDTLIEACVDSVESAIQAQAGGAARVELCAALGEGGTTPSPGTIEVARERLTIGLFVLIRARGGDFRYTSEEYETMARDVTAAKTLGADGVVVGALTEAGQVDRDCIRRLIEAAHPLPVTFHRAFDASRNLDEALDVLQELGVRRVLTSGGERTAEAGIPKLKHLVGQAGDRITILAGGGIDETNAARIVRETGVREIHLRGTRSQASSMTYRNPRLVLGKPVVADDGSRLVTDSARVRAVKDLLS